MPKLTDKERKTSLCPPVDIPIIPPKVDLSDLMSADGLRLNDRTELDVKDGYYSKKLSLMTQQAKNPPNKWSRLKQQNKLFHFYYGRLHNKELGMGNFGKIIIALDNEGQWCVAKKERYPNPDSQEVNILKMLGRSPFDSCEEDIKSAITPIKKSGNQTTNITMMKYHPGIPLNVFIENNILTQNQLLTIFENMVIEVQNIFKQGILHRDIKPHNFIIDPFTLKVTLIDFNCSVILKNQEKKFKQSYEVGTVGFTGLISKNGDFIYSERSEGFSLVSSFLYILAEKNQLNSSISLFTKTPLEHAFHLEVENPTKPPQKNQSLVFSSDVLKARRRSFAEILTAINIAKQNVPTSSLIPADYAHIYVKDYNAIIKDKKLIAKLAKKTEVFLIGNLSDKKELREQQINYCSKILHSLTNARIKIQNKLYSSSRDISVQTEKIVPTKPLTPIVTMDLATVREIRMVVSSELKRLRQRFQPRDKLTEDLKNKKIGIQELQKKVYTKERSILQKRISVLSHFFAKPRPLNGVEVYSMINELKKLRDQMTSTCTYFPNWRISTFFASLRTSTSYKTLQKLISTLENKYKAPLVRSTPIAFTKIR